MNVGSRRSVHFKALVLNEGHVHFSSAILSSVSESISASEDRSRSQALLHAFASKPSRRTTMLPQLYQSSRPMMRSRSRTFGLWTDGNGLRTGATVLSRGH
jgi:hypothetical protein